MWLTSERALGLWGSALERGDGRALQRLAQLGDGLDGVGGMKLVCVAMVDEVEAAELVARQIQLRWAPLQL